jgi:hypothetical protein
MSRMDDRKEPRPAATTTPKKRFRIHRLEERIAPKKGGNGTHNCDGGGSANDSGGSNSIVSNF